LKTKLSWLFLSLPLCASALEMKPWFPTPWEFQLQTAFTYSRYRHVQDARKQLTHPSNDYLITFDLGVVPMFSLYAQGNLDLEVEVELAQTPRQNFGLRSAALQARYLWLDDILGDFASVTTGLILRGATHASLRDVSSPYHAYANAELNSAIGKEWDQGPFWHVRTFALAGVGMAEQGSPWVRGHYALQINQREKFRYEIFTDGYFGFGHKRRINVDHFKGYAHIHHQSIDVGARFAILFYLWGHLDFEYVRRVYARSFPEQVNFFTISYHLPFSLF
jgi:hypothetical protein